MKGLPVFAAIIEAATGVGLILVPSLVGQLLLGIELTGVIVRLAGIALIALAIACRPGPPMLGMLIYNAAVALYLACVGITGDSNGGLLWPLIIGCPVSMTIRSRRSNPVPSVSSHSHITQDEPIFAARLLLAACNP